MSFFQITRKLVLLILHVLSSTVVEEKPHKTRVCVIGAGAAGLSTTRFLTEHLDQFEITVFEKAHEIGGQWLYTNISDFDDNDNPVHSGIYKNMRVNAPKEFCTFWDWPEIKGDNTSFVSHEVILDYLKNYTNHFHLKRFIKFNTIVKNVSLKQVNTSESWEVEVKNLTTGNFEKFTFDAVVVCTGIFSEPSIPKIPGIENFNGQILHSHLYRVPDDFINKSVIILGAGNSGIDIGQELLSVSSKVYLSHNHKKLRFKEFIQIPGVVRYENQKFILKDNTSVDADVILFCTGYKFSFPFLDKSTDIKINNKFVSPLYKHMVNVLHPSMSFISAVRTQISSLMLIPVQAQYVVSLLRNKVKLPAKSVMLENSKLDALAGKHTYLQDAWNYVDEIANLGGFSSIPEYYKIAFEKFINYKNTLTGNLKSFNLVISPDKKSIKIVKINDTEKKIRCTH